MIFLFSSFSSRNEVIYLAEVRSVLSAFSQFFIYQVMPIPLFPINFNASMIFCAVSSSSLVRLQTIEHVFGGKIFSSRAIPQFHGCVP